MRENGGKIGCGLKGKRGLVLAGLWREGRQIGVGGQCVDDPERDVVVG
jgi:hypothetical protein